ncbi:MAG TPA: hypothetical protein DHV36_11560 [Desulfobacteraceae bacterium]|nr:hypothetical protein [Desulfobacteraceae bacterium]|tara:strand:+ start:39 stop:347 length:309 start_codon:yes stop_codon:yes gene_type:complete
MKKFVLLGSRNPHPSKHRLGVIAASDSYEQLQETWKTINAFYRHLGKTFDEAFTEEARQMMNRHPELEKLFDIYFESVIWTVEVVGIFEARDIDETYKAFLT